MQHAPMTEMDRAVWMMKAPLETENAYKDADRADASIMSRKTLPNPDCICMHGEWSGSPAKFDSGWECNDCGRFIPVER